MPHPCVGRRLCSRAVFEWPRSLSPTAPAHRWGALARPDRAGRPRHAAERADRRLLVTQQTRGQAAALERADRWLLVALRTRGHAPALERAAGALGKFGEYGAGWAGIGLCGAALRPAERHRWLAATSAGPVAVLLNYGVKRAVGRRRPELAGHPPLGHATSAFSFPSAHATSATAAAVATGRVSPVARPLLYTLAAAICIGRPYLGMHYPSDVLAGVALGALIGRAYPLPASSADRAVTEDLDAIVATPPEVVA